MPCVRHIRTTACLRYIPNLRSCLTGFHLVAVGVLVCLAFWVVVLLARNIVDHRNLVEKDKQLGIINAISAIYDSTFLLHLDTLETRGSICRRR